MFVLVVLWHSSGHHVDGIVKLQEVWSDQLVVDKGRTIPFGGQHAPDEESTLQQPVEGNHRSQQTWIEFNHSEDAKSDPVDQPPDVVLLRTGLDAMDGNVSRVKNPNDVAQQLSAPAKDQVESAKQNTTHENIHPLHTGLLFQAIKGFGPRLGRIAQ